jgi:hypothetical protein
VGVVNGEFRVEDCGCDVDGCWGVFYVKDGLGIAVMSFGSDIERAKILADTLNRIVLLESA